MLFLPRALPTDIQNMYIPLWFHIFYDLNRSNDCVWDARRCCVQSCFCCSDQVSWEQSNITVTSQHFIDKHKSKLQRKPTSIRWKCLEGDKYVKVSIVNKTIHRRLLVTWSWWQVFPLIFVMSDTIKPIITLQCYRDMITWRTCLFITIHQNPEDWTQQKTGLLWLVYLNDCRLHEHFLLKMCHLKNNFDLTSNNFVDTEVFHCWIIFDNRRVDLTLDTESCCRLFLTLNCLQKLKHLIIIIIIIIIIILWSWVCVTCCSS